jgi:AcrR family transcriptional regulator
MRSHVVQKTTEPRQQRAIETRASLLSAVEKIVAEEGPDAVTTTRVAAETGTAVGTIYRYFIDRDQMLLEAYDATVDRLVETCRSALEGMAPDAPVSEASRRLLDVYLSAADAIPSHAGLLGAMRRLRPLDAAIAANEDRVIDEIVAPFFTRFAPGASSSDPLRLHVVNTVIGTLVDIYLMTPDTDARAVLREEIEAHAMFMISRMR